MKKILFRFFAVALSLSLFFMSATAKETSSQPDGTASAEIPLTLSIKSSYILTIPASMNQLTSGENYIGVVNVRGRITEDEVISIKLYSQNAGSKNVSSSFLLCDSDELSYTLNKKQMSFTQEEIMAVDKGTGALRGTDKDVTITIAQADWDAAPAGTYQDTLTFVAMLKS